MFNHLNCFFRYLKGNGISSLLAIAELFLLIFLAGCTVIFDSVLSLTPTATPTSLPAEPSPVIVTPSDVPSPTVTDTFTPSPTSTFTTSPTPTSTETPTPIATFTPTITLTATFTATATPQPTYAILRGEVNTATVMCYYGPSKDYLFKYALIGGSNLEIIGILPETQYIEVRAIGGTNPCWMNLARMDVKGDINAVKPVDPLDIVLPQSPYYGPLASVNAVRDGSQVTISWSPLNLRAGDDSEQEPYLVETWVCQNGELTFVPRGVYQNSVVITDEPGCDQPSYARVYGVEKHGYTRPVVIPLSSVE